MKIKNRNLTPLMKYRNIFPYLSLNNVFKLRKINKNYEKSCKNFLGYAVDNMD